MSKVSYIVVCYNSERYIRKCIDSITNQTHTDSEIIVIDNNSQDKTTGIINELVLQSKNIKLILNDKNLGYGKAINEVISVCQGEFIVISNADVFFDSKWADRSLNVIKSDEKIISVSGIILFPNGEIQSAGGMMDKYGAVIQKNSKAFHSRMIKSESIFYNDGSAFMIRRKIFNEISFDPKLFLYYEDVDFSWKIRMLGYDITIVPEAISYHDLGHANSEMTVSKFYYTCRNRLYVCQKNYSYKNIITRIPFMIILLFTNAILYDSRKKSNDYKMAFFRALGWNARNIICATAERRKIRKMKKISDSTLDKYLLKKSIELALIKK